MRQLRTITSSSREMITLRGSRGTELLCVIVSLKPVKTLLLTQILTKALTFAVSTQNNQSRTSHTHYKRPRDARHYENTDLKAEPILFCQENLQVVMTFSMIMDVSHFEYIRSKYTINLIVYYFVTNRNSWGGLKLGSLMRGASFYSTW